jgi:predicted RecB family nuclease
VNRTPYQPAKQLGTSGTLTAFSNGAYDAVAMKRMKARLPEFLHTKVDRILERATDLLSVIHQHIYFPVYSNSLKDSGRFLGFEWASNNATGLEAIVWRDIWNTAKAANIKTQLLQYNQDDSRALKPSVESIGRLVTPISRSSIWDKASTPNAINIERY